MTLIRVELHELEFRRDREEWIVGRRSTGDFVAVPYEGMRVVRLLQEGATVQEAERRLREETGTRLDVDGFVEGLAGAGLVAALDGRPLWAAAPPPPTFPWLRPAHVRWTLSPVLHVVVGAVVVTGIVAAVLRPGAVPGWRELLWSERGTPVLLTQVWAGWSLIFLHELAHLCTARAAGVPGRITLGTRLQFLTAQTEVSGIWLAERRVRLTVYLAGMALDAGLCAACVVLGVLLGPRPALSVVALTTLTMLSTQLLVFMRTDLYFVLQDLTRCHDLYGDALAYAGHIGKRALLHPSEDPLARLPRGEGRWVRAYTALLVAGTGVCLAVAATVTYPAAAGLLAHATDVLTGLVAGRSGPVDPFAAMDAVVVVAVVGAFQLLWAGAWWRRHGPRARQAARTVKKTAAKTLTGVFAGGHSGKLTGTGRITDRITEEKP
ncbi:hypothetical protein [Planotetraspora sp. GP83]|uniref:hypothetical protein n=1 Tax=Planotetraspora sp. GP83 TaxID=3156264 RepID=UPI0035197E7D